MSPDMGGGMSGGMSGGMNGMGGGMGGMQEPGPSVGGYGSLGKVNDDPDPVFEGQQN